MRKELTVGRLSDILVDNDLTFKARYHKLLGYTLTFKKSDGAVYAYSSNGSLEEALNFAIDRMVEQEFVVLEPF